MPGAVAALSGSASTRRADPLAASATSTGHRGRGTASATAPGSGSGAPTCTPRCAARAEDARRRACVDAAVTRCSRTPTASTQRASAPAGCSLPTACTRRSAGAGSGWTGRLARAGRRYGLRRHYRVAPWTRPRRGALVAGTREAYVTPVGADLSGSRCSAPARTELRRDARAASRSWPRGSAARAGDARCAAPGRCGSGPAARRRPGAAGRRRRRLRRRAHRARACGSAWRRRARPSRLAVATIRGRVRAAWPGDPRLPAC